MSSFQGEIMKLLGSITLVSVLIVLCAIILSCTGKRPSSVGLTNDRLFPCPKSPNCVSSMSEDEAHYIESLTYPSEKQQAYAALLRVISDQARATIIEQSDNYLHVEFKSKYFRFVDDVEFYFPNNEPIIHIRSASRVGHSDLGVNRKRMHHVREQYYKALEKQTGMSAKESGL
jgi:uncharacterized protein (DUF1499 family)